MTESDFMFTIGYQGSAALVDRGLASRFAKAPDAQLLKAGMYKPAFCRAMFREDTLGMEEVMRAYNLVSPVKYPSLEAVKRAFGVYFVPREINRSIYL